MQGPPEDEGYEEDELEDEEAADAFARGKIHSDAVARLSYLVTWLVGQQAGR